MKMLCSQTIQPDWNQLKLSFNWLPFVWWQTPTRGQFVRLWNENSWGRQKLGMLKICGFGNLWFWTQKFVATDCRSPGNSCHWSFDQQEATGAIEMGASHVWGWYTANYSPNRWIFCNLRNSWRWDIAHYGCGFETSPLCFIWSSRTRNGKKFDSPEWRRGCKCWNQLVFQPNSVLIRFQSFQERCGREEIWAHPTPPHCIVSK